MRIRSFRYFRSTSGFGRLLSVSRMNIILLVQGAGIGWGKRSKEKIDHISRDGSSWIWSNEKVRRADVSGQSPLRCFVGSRISTLALCVCLSSQLLTIFLNGWTDRHFRKYSDLSARTMHNVLPSYFTKVSDRPFSTLVHTYPLTPSQIISRRSQGHTQIEIL